MTTFFEENRKYFIWAAYLVAALLILLWLGPLIADKRPARWVQSSISGLLIGGIYALIALGIVIINKASGVFNFAHGYMMLFGGLIFYSFFSSSGVTLFAAVILSVLTVLMVITMTHWRDILKPRNLIFGIAAIAGLTALLMLPELTTQLNILPGRGWVYVRAIIGATTGAMLLGLIVERFTIRPLIGQPLFAMVLMTLAIGRLLQGFIQLTWGSVEIPLALFVNPDGSSLTTIKLDGLKDALGGVVIIQPGLLISFGLSLLAFGAFVVFFQFTNVGLAMRASAENQRLAQAIGLRVRVILAVAWAIAALLATIGGVLQGGATSLSVNMPLLALLAFPAVLLGGLESIGGALIGGLIIGVLQEWANLLFPGTQAGTELAPYVVLMVVLIIRPDGLFGQKRIERI
ncbi:MAG: branched-chain amino acid ABC transporter permease [Anaerolineae bacterium]|nr:branched-chain amino acid ABC transporter permease [Anaerolineae bacterium]